MELARPLHNFLNEVILMKLQSLVCLSCDFLRLCQICAASYSTMNKHTETLFDSQRALDGSRFICYRSIILTHRKLCRGLETPFAAPSG